MELNFPNREKRILEYWKENKIFEKSTKQREGAPDFVFYEGPPTANAKPGVHHVLARAFKDVVCRYKTMKGFRVIRKAGWDVHGLPVEISVEKELGLKNKKEIEEYGIEKFNAKCRESVWRYTEDWKDLTQRIGYWLDLENPYITGDPLYMESVFYILKTIWSKGLLEKGNKVIPYCPRCGTGLSSHEVAQGYKKITEPAIYIKFKVLSSQVNSKQSTVNSHLLVWTTTPWTLPANAAIAVNPKIDYVLVKKDDEYLILAKERLSVLGENYEAVEEIKGKDLIGLQYQPLFDQKTLDAPMSKKMYKILGADFVNTEEGTGLVHIAPAFGQDDMALWQEQGIKDFPQPVDEQGKFKPEAKKWVGIFVKQADPLIIEELKEKGLLFKQEQYEHDYPFCWRCSTPLLYYARENWFIRTTKSKKDLIENNQTINWVPSHLKEGRFGEWLNELKDWSLSRERYWGTPLPVWQCQTGKSQIPKWASPSGFSPNSKQCDNIIVIGSREDLLKQKFTTNNYFLLRHGEAVSNVENFYSSFPERREVPLTEKGRKQIKKAIQMLEKEKIDIIFSSDLLRTKETAKIAGKALGIEPIYEARLREIDTGKMNGKNIGQAERYFNPDNNLNKEKITLKKFNEGFPEGEKYSQVTIRTLDFIKEIEQKYQNKNILIVSHEILLLSLMASARGYTIKESAGHREELRHNVGELKKLDYKSFPYNKEGELDFHRPYIDEIEFFCPKCGGKMRRVTEVIDCWFDSGAMPFGQAHYPFAFAQDQKSKILRPAAVSGLGKNQKFLFPADYISEAVDQTRGWFYTLLAISTLLGLEAPYKNVISLGHVLDKKGEKMSKSKGNVIDSREMIEKYGADALRWYFYTVNQPGDPKLFKEKDIDQSLKKFIMTLQNCFVFYNTYAEEPARSCYTVAGGPGVEHGIIRKSFGAVQHSHQPEPITILDKWIVSRLHSTIEEVTRALDCYDVVRASRNIEQFVINDLSLWYIRRSRNRLQRPKNEKEKQKAALLFRYILTLTARVSAPFIPFLSEEIYQGLSGNAESVHLQKWPESKKKFIYRGLEKNMKNAREIVKQVLQMRNELKIKVRQPLSLLEIEKTDSLSEELLLLIKEETNVKEIRIRKKIQKDKKEFVYADRLALKTAITKELKEEGFLRELIRRVQQMRKKGNLRPEDRIEVYISGDEELIKLLEKNKTEFLLQTKAKNILFRKKGKNPVQEAEIKIEDQNLWLGLKLVL